MLTFIDINEKVQGPNIDKTPMFEKFKNGKIELYVKPKELRIGTDRKLEFNSPIAYYLKDGSWNRLQPTQFNTVTDSNLDIVSLEITDDTIPSGTVFIGNFPQVVINTDIGPFEIDLPNFEIYYEPGFYKLSSDAISDEYNDFQIEITGYPDTELKQSIQQFESDVYSEIDEYVQFIIEETSSEISKQMII